MLHYEAPPPYPAHLLTPEQRAIFEDVARLAMVVSMERARRRAEDTTAPAREHSPPAPAR